MRKSFLIFTVIGIAIALSLIAYVNFYKTKKEVCCQEGISDFIIAEGTVQSTQYNDYINMKITKILRYDRHDKATWLPLKENDEVSILLNSIYNKNLSSGQNLSQIEIDKMFEDFVSSAKDKTLVVTMSCSGKQCYEVSINVKE